MEIRLSQCLKNKKQRAKAKNSKKDNSTVDCDEDCDEESFIILSQSLLDESKDTQNNIAAFKQFLQKTRKLRQKDVKNLPASEILEKYPVLQNTRLVSI